MAALTHSATPISIDEKRAAVQRVLQSRALGRSEQLRAFFRHVCEAEMGGRAHEINEYALGVVVLGRPAGYSPAQDSSVRSRAYELRNKLRAYYEAEAPDDPIRIQIDKGGYVPRFERGASEGGAGGTVSAAAARLPTAELRALWGTLLDGEAPLIVTFDVRLFFFAPPTGLVVRDYRINDPSELSHSEPLANFRREMAVEELRETRDYAEFGAVHAAFLLGRLLAGSRRDVVMKHSGSLDWQDVYNNNVVFIGKPEAHPILRSFLDDWDFVVDECGVVQNARPKSGERAAYESAVTHGQGEKYAIITRVRGPQSGRYLLVLSGVGAELTWALGQSVTNPESARAILSHLRLPSGEYADAFQVVIRASFQSNVPVKIGYVTHHVLSSG